MPVIGMDITSIEGKRGNEASKNLRVENGPRIKNVTTKKINSLGKEVLDIDFEYECLYRVSEKKKPFANITIKGNVLFLSEDVKETIKKWKKNKKLEQKVALPVLNNIIRRCLTKIINISEELKLPPPIRFPVAKPSE